VSLYPPTVQIKLFHSPSLRPMRSPFLNRVVIFLPPPRDIVYPYPPQRSVSDTFPLPITSRLQSELYLKSSPSYLYEAACISPPALMAAHVLMSVDRLCDEGRHPSEHGNFSHRFLVVLNAAKDWLAFVSFLKTLSINGKFLLLYQPWVGILLCGCPAHPHFIPLLMSYACRLHPPE